VGTADSLDTDGADYTINVQPSGLGTYENARQAFVDDATASGILTITSNGPSFGAPLFISGTGDWYELTDGTDALYPSGIAGNLMFQYLDTDVNDKEITVIGSGVAAGSETVTQDSDGLILNIQTGVSTAADIITLCEGTAAFSGIAAQASFTINDYERVETSGVWIGINDDRLFASAHFTGATSNAATAALLKSAIDTLGPSGITASQDGVHVYLTCDSVGTAGNSNTLITSDSNAISVYPSGGYYGSVPYVANFVGGLGAWAVSGVGTTSNAQKAYNEYPMGGGASDGPDAYFMDNNDTALTSSFVKFSWGFHANELVINNDDLVASSNTIVGSFDGVNTDFTLKPTKQLKLTNLPWGYVYLKYTTGAPAYSLTVI
jgi:hypothetical protein